jgi:hypothetical protein
MPTISSFRLAAAAVAIASGFGALSAFSRPEPVRPAAPPAAGGLTFRYAVSSSTTDKRRKEAVDVRATVRMQDGKIRMDYDAGTGPMGQKDAYILITTTPAQFAVVNAKNKDVLLISPAMFGSGFGAMMNNPMMKFTIKNVKFSFKDEGPGETLLGYKTRKVKMYNGSESELKILMMTQRSITSDSSEHHIASGMMTDIDEQSMLAWGRSFMNGLKVTSPEIAAEIERYNKEYQRGGFSLKSTTWSTVSNGKDKTTADVVTMEVTDLQKGAIDKSVFEIPANFKVNDLTKLGANGN